MGSKGHRRKAVRAAPGRVQGRVSSCPEAGTRRVKVPTARRFAALAGQGACTPQAPGARLRAAASWRAARRAPPQQQVQGRGAGRPPLGMPSRRWLSTKTSFHSRHSRWLCILGCRGAGQGEHGEGRRSGWAGRVLPRRVPTSTAGCPIPMRSGALPDSSRAGSKCSKKRACQSRAVAARQEALPHQVEVGAVAVGQQLLGVVEEVERKVKDGACGLIWGSSRGGGSEHTALAEPAGWGRSSGRQRAAKRAAQRLAPGSMRNRRKPTGHGLAVHQHVVLPQVPAAGAAHHDGAFALPDWRGKERGQLALAGGGVVAWGSRRPPSQQRLRGC